MEKKACKNCKHWITPNDDSRVGVCDKLSAKTRNDEVKTEDTFYCSLHEDKDETK